ncbi:MAG: hypothetical protein JNJ89_02615 [Rubrivivax sp.]|nr:hypothetical protein [Rubrivivax sp.]
MTFPIGVIAVFVALAVWLVLLVWGVRQRRHGWAIGFGILLMLVLNARYFVEGIPAGIAFFIGIYDVLNNFGLAPDAQVAGMAPCAEGRCSAWGERFALHTTWGVAFYERFVADVPQRTLLLYGHLLFNSLVFVLMHVQMLRTGAGPHRRAHKLLGRASLLFLTLGVGCAVWLASEHGAVPQYGGRLAEFGFYSMSAFVYGTAIMGVWAIRSGDRSGHRIWMWRFAGTMWGSFWLFRIMLFVLDPLLRHHDTVAILVCIWFSAPLGLAIAEVIRRRLDSTHRPAPDPVGPGGNAGRRGAGTPERQPHQPLGQGLGD